LHTVLEHNLDYPAARGFKTGLKERVLKTGKRIETHLPFLKPGQGSELLMQINALVIGFQHMAEPSGVMRQVLDDEDMALFRVDLEVRLQDSLRTLLMGLAYEAKYRRE
ncbi:MAG: TetR/AcrR family transcriptional regulator, partial [Gammaproteobacteria bacterium]|nr:TetR/AcrR family transcriptional regulator [Gammaproteobacteria bacterium]